MKKLLLIAMVCVGCGKDKRVQIRDQYFDSAMHYFNIAMYHRDLATASIDTGNKNGYYEQVDLFCYNVSNYTRCIDTFCKYAKKH